MKFPSLQRSSLCRLLLAAVLLATLHGSAQPQAGATLERHSAIFDPVRQRMIVYGGSPGLSIIAGDCWQLQLGASPRWDSLVTTGTAPPPLIGHTAVYDPVGNQMILFGGYDGTSFQSSVYALSLGSTPAWSLLQPAGAGPGARAYASAVYDSVRDRILVFGGQASNGSALAETWSLTLRPSPVWELIAPHGGPPPARYLHTAIYDRAHDQMVIFGGFFTSGYNDVWSLTLTDTTWTRRVPAGTLPNPRSSHAAVWDPQGDRMIVFGGNAAGNSINDTWAFPLAAPFAWTQLAPLSTPPSGRRYIAAIDDPVYRRMVVFGGEANILDPTWALGLNATPRWSPYPAVAQLSALALQFPSVTPGDTVALPLTILNAGLQRLDVGAIEHPAQQIELGGFAPAQLAWNDSLTVMVSLLARTIGHVQDSLVVVSGDPSHPRTRVALGIDVHALEFETRAVGIPEQAPLGVALNVVVTPSPGTRIDTARLYHRAGGSAGAFDSLAFTPLGAAFLATIPAAAVTEQGIEYYVRVEHNGYSALQPATAPVGFDTQVVAPPASLAAIPQPTSGAGFLQGRDIRVEAVLPAGSQFVAGTLHYRRGGETSFATAPLAVMGTLERPSATIPGDHAGARGVEYWLGVQTLTATLRAPAVSPAIDVVPIRVQDLAEAPEHPAGRYRLLSVPLDFGSDFSSGIDALLTDQFGGYDPVRWRLYSYDPDAHANIEWSSAVASQFRPAPGRAFWLVTRAAHRVDTRPIEGVSVSTRTDAMIVLRPGWNAFGNPFDFPVAWSAVRHTAATGAPVAFDPAAGTSGDYAPATPTVLQPFEGYFIENTAAAAETLWVAPQPAPELLLAPDPTDPAGARPPTPASQPAAIASDVWRMRLRAATDRAVDGGNEFGINPAGLEGRDALDASKPPVAPGPWVRVAFTHPEWRVGAGIYRSDIRAPGADGASWDIEVRSEAAGEPVTLELADVLAAPPGTAVRLVDRELGSAVDALGLPQGTNASRLNYRLVSYGSTPYRLTILAGSSAFVQRASEAALAVPAHFSVEPNEPNPFRLATRIRFGLAGAASVSAEVYSVAGQRIATLLDNAMFTPGVHSVIWDGATGNGVKAASGVYLLRVTAGTETLTRRLVLVR